MTNLEREVATLIVDKLMLSGVTGQTMDVNVSLAEEYGLDSIDFLELAMGISKTYGVEFSEDDSENESHFMSVSTLAAYVVANRSSEPTAEPVVTAPESHEEHVYREITAGLQEMFDFPIERLRYDAKLVEDLELDSLDALDLVVRLQETLGARIPDDKLMELRTIGDVVKVVVNLSEDSK